MITKNGERIDLTIHDNIPYVDLGTYEFTPYECHHALKINDLLEHAQDDFNELDDIDDVGRSTRRVHLDGESGLETLNEDQKSSRHVKKLKKKKKKKKRKKKKGRAVSRRKRMASPGEEASPEDGEYTSQEPLMMDHLVMRQTSKMKDTVLLKMPLKVMRMTSKSMLLKANPG